MSAGKLLFTFASGVAAGVAAAYFADPKGTEKRFKALKKDFNKRSKLLEQNISIKLDGFKKSYNDLVDKYVQNGKEVLDKSGSSVQLK